jgi:hypothetical protein
MPLEQTFLQATYLHTSGVGWSGGGCLEEGYTWFYDLIGAEVAAVLRDVT